MDFNFTEEQQLLADTVRRFVREQYTFEARRNILKTHEGWSREIWRQLAELGLTALNVPAEHGGLGASPVETLLVMNALGEGLVVEPFLSAAVMMPALLSRLGDERTAAELFNVLGSGERIVVLAHQEAPARGEVQFVSTRAQRVANGYVLDGCKTVIAHGDAADELLISARISGSPDDRSGVSVFRVDPKATGVTVTGYPTIDGQRAADIQLKGVQLATDRLVGGEGHAFEAIEAAHEITIAALCAEAVGIMQAMNAATLEYTKSRKQFGMPIAKFQVLQHRMADMYLQAEQATSMSYLAAIKCVDPDPAERRRALSAAKVVIDQAGRFIGQNAIQLHGGMGMTDELMVSHHFKRVTTIGLTFGDIDFHLQKFAALTS